LVPSEFERKATEMEDTKGKDMRRFTKDRGWVRISLVVGAVVVGLLLVCVVVWSIYAVVGGVGSDTGWRADRSMGGEGAMPAQPPMEAVVEKALEIPAAEPDTLASAYGVSGLPEPAERLIIRSGNISMVVEDTRAAQAAIEGMVARMAGEGAFVVSSEEYGSAEGNQPQITMSIRIPAARFDQIMNLLAEQAVQVTSRTQSAQDVTEEYVDLEARLESLETARQRLLDIMAEARTTKDLLEAEQQLTQREAEIESIKGRMQYLSQSAKLASIWIELQPSILSQPVGDHWRPLETARRAVETLVDGLRGLADLTIFFAIAVLPWLLAVGLVLFFVVRLARLRSRLRREKRTAHGQDSEPAG
jgi:chemotaxis protein histidine kinase CheA